MTNTSERGEDRTKDKAWEGRELGAIQLKMNQLAELGGVITGLPEGFWDRFQSFTLTDEDVFAFESSLSEKPFYLAHTGIIEEISSFLKRINDQASNPERYGTDFYKREFGGQIDRSARLANACDRYVSPLHAKRNG